MFGFSRRINSDSQSISYAGSPKLAHELVGLTSWINSDPKSLHELRGQVILLEFWTFGCINCVRTLPHVERWYQTYKTQGFEIIGIHSPEFDYERVPANVANAIQQHNLSYPAALDNEWSTWKAYNNHYWPALYLIDKKGLVRYVHLGEGKYDLTEQAIQGLLQE
jgi:thiol-disulfide isomerase/thioredoxin